MKQQTSAPPIYTSRCHIFGSATLCSLPPPTTPSSFKGQQTALEYCSRVVASSVDTWDLCSVDVRDEKQNDHQEEKKEKRQEQKKWTGQTTKLKFFPTFPDVLSHSFPVPSALAPLPLHAKSANCMPTSTSPSADARKTGSCARYCSFVFGFVFKRFQFNMVSFESRVFGFHGQAFSTQHR